MNKVQDQIIEFDGGGVIRLEVLEKGINLIFQAPHFGEQFRIVSMNVILTENEAAKISEWLSSVLGDKNA